MVRLKPAELNHSKHCQVKGQRSKLQRLFKRTLPVLRSGIGRACTETLTVLFLSMSIISVDFGRNLAVRLFLNISLTPWLCVSAQHHSASSMQHAWRRDGGRLCWGALSQERVFCALMGHVELLGAQHVMVWWEREVLWGQSKHLLRHKYPGMFTCLLRT